MRTGGRTATFTAEDLVEAGVRIGLADVTVQAVATALGVTTAAVYRRVPSRAALETLVGEAVLDGLVLTDDPGHSTVEQLVGFAARLREFTLANPGTAQYFLGLFPRGRSGVRLLEQQIVALGRRGYDPAAATALSSAMATVALGATVAEQEREVAHRDPVAVETALAAMAGSALVQQAVAGLPPHTPEDYFMLMVTALATGLVAAYPAGAPITLPGRDR
ncbi:hypothetical protein AB0M47_40705 [Hamadaea sp. NPDC051192]|uniref:TetR/AcrR family transcriptional regulator n=1 Tax=Hamadaea sp. NPDC051192 TaxID=3154940 RepID=UPI00342101F8